MSTQLRLEHVRVRGLFGTRNYDILMSGVGATVMTGSNGSGKSTILGLIKAVADCDLPVLSNAPIGELELVFRGGQVFKLTKPHGGTTFTIQFQKRQTKVPLIGDLGDLPPWVKSVARDHASTDAVRLRAQLRHSARNFAEYKEAAARLDAILDWTVPEWLDSFRHQFQVALITDQRLLVVDEERQTDARRSEERKSTSRAVENASNVIRDYIKSADSEYSDVSKQQDRDFPRNVIRAITSGEHVEIEKLSNLERELDATRERLHRVGLLLEDSQVHPLVPRGGLDDPRVRPVIWTFLLATTEKLSVLAPLATKLAAFKGFLDSRYRDKSVELSKRDGVMFSVAGGGRIVPRNLSSGEQQMMMLAYEIVFQASEGTLVLIDEPELSLHVDWQETLIDNLLEMGAASSLQFLMATHSPTLLAGHRGLERSLDELSVDA